MLFYYHTDKQNETYSMVEDTSQTIKENGLMEKKTNKNEKSKTEATTMKCIQRKVFLVCARRFISVSSSLR